MSALPALINVVTREIKTERLPYTEVATQLVQGANLKTDLEFGVREQMRAPTPGALPDPGTSNAYFLYPWIELRVTVPEAEAAQPVWTATIEFEVQYNLEPDTPGWDIDEIVRFLANNMMFQVWPFIRETVSSLAQRSGVSIPLLVPLNRADSVAMVTVQGTPDTPKERAPAKKKSRSTATAPRVKS